MRPATTSSIGSRVISAAWARTFDANPATRPYPRYSSLLTADFNGNSSYNALIAAITIRRRPVWTCASSTRLEKPSTIIFRVARTTDKLQRAAPAIEPLLPSM